jgi:DNA-binding NarL/FixJ family response regulator
VTGPIRVLIVDDHAVVRYGLSAMLGAEADIEVVGEAGDGAEAIRLSAALRPDVVLMDLTMEGMDGAEATRRLAAAAPRPRTCSCSRCTTRRSS